MNQEKIKKGLENRESQLRRLRLLRRKKRGSGGIVFDDEISSNEWTVGCEGAALLTIDYQIFSLARFHSGFIACRPVIGRSIA